MSGDPGRLPNRNTLWARALADTWARLGVRHICVGSGSRSAPLVEAFSRDPRFTMHPHVDERSAAFFALGVGAATGEVAVVVTTSGTAAANLLPAVVEASQSEIPLLAVTADRPARLRGRDANQTIQQVGLYGEYARLAIDVSLPEPRDEAVRGLRDIAARAWAAAVGVPRGPAHVNVQFEKPLEPTRVEGDVPADLHSEATETEGPEIEPIRAAPEGARLAELLDGFSRPLVVCGPGHDPRIGHAALALGRALACPVLADPLSGARFGATAVGRTVVHADLALSDPTVADALAPDVIVRVGRAPTSGAVLRFLDRHRAARQIIVDAGGRWKDHLDAASHQLRADPVTTLHEAADAGARPADAEWDARWREVDRAVATAVAPALAETWFEGSIAAAVAAALPEDATWFIGNSMPIRDVDAFAGVGACAPRTVGFRGASGIDGNVSGAFGSTVARDRPAAALMGDLTLLHDVGALLLAPSLDVPLQLVVIQNRGGGIFHMLPIREHDPPFTPYVVMPHHVDLQAVAAAARIPHSPVASLDALRDTLSGGWKTPGVRLVEAEIDRQTNWERRDAVVALARAAASAAL